MSVCTVTLPLPDVDEPAAFEPGQSLLPEEWDILGPTGEDLDGIQGLSSFGLLFAPTIGDGVVPATRTRFGRLADHACLARTDCLGGGDWHVPLHPNGAWAALKEAAEADKPLD